MGDAVIELRDLTVRFGRTIALDSIATTFFAGSATALVGPNGSGKTTLLNVVAGLTEPNEGRCSVSTGPVAFVRQRPGHETWMPLSAREVITMGLYGETGLVGRINSARRARIDDTAERTDVTSLLNERFGELSGGQQQRVLLAQALVQDPAVLLMDEPITGLDLASQQMILDLIETERSTGTTVVMSTHHLDEARHCDTVLLMANNLIAGGTPEEVLTQDLLRVAYGGRFLGDHDGHDHGDLLILDDHGHGSH
ncbi:MAG: metal ABC transporter ATP-binding protein [Acidobacteria bacterium]|nr:metal ABC transporter ATP-binding protein [Acidobacteriota bacterium]